MAPRQKASIGELYGKISVPTEDFSGGQGRLVREQDHPFVRLCKRLAAFMPGSKGAKFTEENAKAVEFLKWKLTPSEFAGATTAMLVLCFAAGLVLGTIVLYSPLNEILKILGATGTSALLYAYLPFVALAAGGVYLFTTFPNSEAKREQTRALTYVPEMMGYMVMSIKLVPNLEKAVEFASDHGKGKIAKDFKDLIWQTQLGMYNSISEGLDALAYRWGYYSSEFKRALMRIRASVIENSESKRYALLDETMSEMLDSIRNKMEQYARDLSQPSTMLFYIGVLLPLLLIIILPVGSSFTGAPLANPIILALIYNILIPLIAVVFAYNIIQNRPPTYEPPAIPDNYPGLPPKWKASVSGIKIDVRVLAVLVVLIGGGLSFVVSSSGLLPMQGSNSKILDACANGEFLLCPDLSRSAALERAGRPATYFDVSEEGNLYQQKLREKLRAAGEDADVTNAQASAAKETRSEEQLFFASGENDIAPYKLVFGLLITLGAAAYVLLYYSSIYKRRAQLDVQQMESEFKDSLYILASRMGENKPVEDAMKHVMEFLPDLKISRTVFGRTLDNIKLMGMPLEQAVFDQNMGSVAKIPSTVIKGSMKMLVDSVQLGSNVAARTMIALSIQLQNAEKVNNNLKVLVSDVTGTMKTMAMFIAPMVLGITTSLQRIVIVTIASIANSGIAQSSGSANDALGGSFANAGGFIKPEAIANIATPTQFILIVALYIIELVVIMGFFTTKIEEDNDLLLRINLATFLPVAIIMFVVSMALSNLFVGSL